MPLCLDACFSSSRAQASIEQLHLLRRTVTCVNGCSRIEPWSCRRISPCGFRRLQRKTLNTFPLRETLVFQVPFSFMRNDAHALFKRMHSRTFSVKRRSLHSSPSSSAASLSRNGEEKERIVLNATLKAENTMTVPASGSLTEHHHPQGQSFSSMVLSPPLPPLLQHISSWTPADRAFFLLGSITFMLCGAFVALLATAIPTLNAMKRAALSFERLADTARQEVPSTMAAIRLSGMEISDLTLELSDMSQEISESVKSSARAVRAAEVGIRRMGSLAASQTLSMLQEHASAPVEAVKPVVATAAETTRQAVSQAHKAVLGLAGMPVLSKWIQKKKIEEQKKIDEDTGLESIDGSVESCED